MTDGAAQSAASAPGPLGRERPERLDALDDVEARQLMLRVGLGDYDAFETLFDRYHRAVYNFYLKLCQDTQLAEDGVQETFLRLWKAASRYHPSAAFRTYLFQIAKNFWLNEKEKRDRRYAVSLDARNGQHAGGESRHAGESREMHETLAGPAQDPHEAAVESERRSLVHRALAELDEKHRMVVVLNLFHGFRYREIAEILEIPEGTVKTRMHTAEKKLRAWINAKPHDSRDSGALDREESRTEKQEEPSPGNATHA